jgi:hypothetical protein
MMRVPGGSQRFGATESGIQTEWPAIIFGNPMEKVKRPDELYIKTIFPKKD